MKKRSIYKLGDVFKIPLGEDIYGLGRILIVQSPGVLAGFYHQIVKNNDNVDIASLCDRQYLFRIQCGDVGLKQKKWEIVGNVPLESKVDLPLFWGRDALTNELYIREYMTAENDPLGWGGKFNDRPTTLQEIAEKCAEPDGLSGWRAVDIKLKMYLQKAGALGAFH